MFTSDTALLAEIVLTKKWHYVLRPQQCHTFYTVVIAVPLGRYLHWRNYNAPCSRCPVLIRLVPLYSEEHVLDETVSLSLCVQSILVRE